MSAEDVRKLHTPFKVYDECGHSHEKEDEAAGIVEIDDVGISCEDGVLYTVCRECDTTDGATHEYTDEGKWPCRTIEALDKP